MEERGGGASRQDIARPAGIGFKEALESRVVLARKSLLADMRAGVFPGGKLPREETLAQQEGVSRTTIRAALQSLERDGIVSRRHGVGTFFHPDMLTSPVPLNRLAGFEDLIGATGAKATAVVQHCGYQLDVEHGLYPQGVGDRIFTVEKLFYADDVPCAHVIDAFPQASLKQDLSDPDFHPPASTFQFAAEFCIEPIDYALAEVQIKMADQATAAQLHVPADSPLFHLSEKHYAVSGNLIGQSAVDLLTGPIQLMIVRRNA